MPSSTSGIGWNSLASKPLMWVFETLFDKVLVYPLSRWTRPAYEALMFRSLLRRNSVTVVSVNDPDCSSPAGRLIDLIVQVVDAEYWERHSGPLGGASRPPGSGGDDQGGPARSGVAFPFVRTLLPPAQLVLHGNCVPPGPFSSRPGGQTPWAGSMYQILVFPVGMLHYELMLAGVEIPAFSHSFGHFRGQDSGFGVDQLAAGAVTRVEFP